MQRAIAAPDDVDVGASPRNNDKMQLLIIVSHKKKTNTHTHMP